MAERSGTEARAVDDASSFGPMQIEVPSSLPPVASLSEPQPHYHRTHHWHDVRPTPSPLPAAPPSTATFIAGSNIGIAGAATAASAVAVHQPHRQPLPPSSPASSSTSSYQLLATQHSTTRRGPGRPRNFISGLFEDTGEMANNSHRLVQCKACLRNRE
ncbi:hypothetical protein EV182_008418, partial [Spiromyces aspiralis]